MHHVDLWTAAPLVPWLAALAVIALAPLPLPKSLRPSRRAHRRRP